MVTMSRDNIWKQKQKRAACLPWTWWFKGVKHPAIHSSFFWYFVEEGRFHYALGQGPFDYTFNFDWMFDIFANHYANCGNQNSAAVYM